VQNIALAVSDDFSFGRREKPAKDSSETSKSFQAENGRFLPPVEMTKAKGCEYLTKPERFENFAGA
jgi:hypothetical protein